jgi:hypothetical protein
MAGIFCLECGLPADLPGIREDTPGLSFPIWADYTFLDLALATFALLPDTQLTVVHEASHRSSLTGLLGPWKQVGIRAREIEDDPADLAKALAGRGDSVLVSGLGHAALLDPSELAETQAAGEPCRISCGGKKLPLYALPLDLLKEILGDGQRVLAESAHAAASLLHELLPARIRHTVEIGGTCLFVDNLMELWEANHLLRESIGNPAYAHYIEPLASVAPRAGDAHIGPGGHVRNSLLGAGSRIDGYVEDSVVFPGVVVREQAEIRRSVIMDGNVIGVGAKVRHAMLMPATRDVPAGGNVASGSTIGGSGRASSLRNDDHPKQIKQGLCLLGMDAAIPSKTTVEAGCYVPPDTPASRLRSMKRVPKGATVS